MSAITTVAQPAGLALVPTNINDAIRLAEMMAKGKLVPRDLQSSPADCLLVIEQATRWGMSPFAVAQEVSVIQGKLMHSGKIVAAAIQSSGVLAGRLHYDYSGEGDSRAVTVSGTLVGESEPRTITVRLGDVRTNNKVWTTQPDQQLAYHGARVWARRYAPEVMLGVWSPEEMPEAPAEPREVPNMATADSVARVAEAQAARDDRLPVITPRGDLIYVSRGKWLEAVTRAVAQMEDAAALGGWDRAMEPHITAVADIDHALANQAAEIIGARYRDFDPAEGEAAE